MAGFNELQRLSGQSIQSTLAGLENLVERETQSVQQNAPLGSDNAVLTGGGPSYMQAVQALAEMALLAGSGMGELNHLHSLSGGDHPQALSRNNQSPSFRTNYNRENGGGFFNPINYRPLGVNQRNSGNGNQGGNGGYGNGGRTNAGNVATGGIDRMLELIIAQTLGKNAEGAQPQQREDAVTLDGRTPDSEANGFNELAGALVMLLAEEINSAGQNSSQPTPQLRDLLSQLSQIKGNGETLSQPQMQALMDEMAVMQLIESTRQNSSGSGSNPMVNTIMQLMQNLLGAQSGNSVNPAQMKQLLGALMNNLQGEGGDSSQAAQMMQLMLPEMMEMLDAESRSVPGAVNSQQRNNAPSKQNSGAVPLQPFSASISSDGISTGNRQGSDSPMTFQMQPGANGGVSILDASGQKDMAGGIQIGASMGQDDGGEEKIKVGTFSWNGGADAVAMNAKGEAAVTSDGGKTWAPLPQQGVSTYNPGNGGPTITYNPDTKTVSFSASGDHNNHVSATMRAGGDGVSFVNIEGTGGITAGGQLPGAM